MGCRAAALLLLLALLVAVCSAGTGASRISIVNDADEGVASFRSLFSVSGFQQAANDLRSIVENAISHIHIDKISGSIGTPIHIDIDYEYLLPPSPPSFTSARALQFIF
ncbi:uncharacterized protein ACA1_281610 [Acanthamoeba castellanii str. Neff]|uniref:Uncharacterized protein n=1 Tax=Acanthamoeba castellanii (strain ATCC 30010 / Neff) TaxID=1257118 RepID=L8H750_ACACF|nr:uncharacterized protein ACA1_281610 [Acanthamoeba castellanii str. Neff]ELR21047.1 hypothetical protein ACA1_281610 [Acanthamoeba castellanii str. Neff]